MGQAIMLRLPHFFDRVIGERASRVAGRVREDRMKLGVRLKSSVAVVLAMLVFAGAVRANSGTALSLNNIQAGTEKTTPSLVTNGGFESVTSLVPDNWLVTPAGANLQL